MSSRLPIDYSSRYQTFRQTLEQLRQTTNTANPDRLKSQAVLIQAMFQEQLLPLNLEALEPSIAHHLQSYQVEINKQLRLLNTDLNFLQAARQPSTLEQRRQQVGDRLATLIRYCDAVVAPTENVDG